MPIKRKIVRFGHSFCVFLPKSWVTLLEEKYDHEIKAVSIEVNGELRIKPILPETGERKQLEATA